MAIFSSNKCMNRCRIIRMKKVIVLACILLISGVSSATNVDTTALFSAIFAFGDSLADPGNNNNLNSWAKANYMPYGIDFEQGPSGRFCNGKTVIDYLGELLEIYNLQAYTSLSAAGHDTLRGVNYASAAGGILEETGQHLGERFSLSQQVQNFKDTLNQLKLQIKDSELSSYLAKALAILLLGSNDYVNNYLLTSLYRTSYEYNPKDYADLLINRFAKQILALQSLGLRKFFLGGIGPLGCIPNQLAGNLLLPHGKCILETNDMVEMFNARLLSIVDELNKKYNESVFVYGNTFGAFSDILTNARTYGFSVINRGCCGVGRNRGQVSCLPMSVPCPNRNQYVFWDAFHPTQATNQILARRAYSGSASDCYPLNIQQMGQI